MTWPMKEPPRGAGSNGAYRRKSDSRPARMTFSWMTESSWTRSQAHLVGIVGHGCSFRIGVGQCAASTKVDEMRRCPRGCRRAEREIVDVSRAVAEPSRGPESGVRRPASTPAHVCHGMRRPLAALSGGHAPILFSADHDEVRLPTVGLPRSLP